jgi:hypothetical protein
MEYRHLNPQKLTGTAQLISERVEAMFPGSGLGEVSREVVSATQHVIGEVNELRKPLWQLRIWITLGILFLCAIPIAVGALLDFRETFGSLAEFMQATDAGFNVLILLLGGAVFLMKTEARSKRNRAHKALNELRSLAHVIDMHQLSKDPGIRGWMLPGPKREQRRPACIGNDTDLWFYLSFSSDLLAILGKSAAWFAEHLTDRDILQTVNDVENLCNDTSRKVWQKMSFLNVPRPEGIAPDI